jgi:flagellar hook protein FlgE
MFTSINALYVQQQYMDVVSDNLANVNTPGFKSSYMSFKSQFSQTLSTGAGPTTNLGGINPMQVGLGAILGSVTPVFTSGALESTGRELDLAIEGEGFFVYKNGDTPYYSRDGNLQVDSEGYLVNGSTGARLQGWQSDITTQELDTTKSTTSIKIPIDSAVAMETTKVTLKGNLDVTSNYTDPQWNTTTGSTTVGGSTVTTTSKVLAADSEALGSYSTTFGIYDSLGNLQDITLTFQRVSTTGSLSDGSTFSKTNDSSGSAVQYWTVHVTGITGSPTLLQQVTSGGSVINLLSNLSTGSSVSTSGSSFDTTYPPLEITTGDTSHSPIGGIKFDENGQICYSAQDLTLNIGGGPGAATRTVTFDLSSLTMLNSTSSVAANDQNGLPGGGLTGFNLSSSDGKIYGVYSNGSQRVIGQIALATFSNPSGLIREGNNEYTIGLNSGLARISTPGTGDKGTIQSGYQEGSNVDMSREFANMILAQRGFEASTRMMTVADTMLQELVNIGK